LALAYAPGAEMVMPASEAQRLDRHGKGGAMLAVKAKIAEGRARDADAIGTAGDDGDWEQWEVRRHSQLDSPGICFDGSGTAAANGLPLTATISAIDLVSRAGAMEFFVTETNITNPIQLGLRPPFNFHLNFAAGDVPNTWNVTELAFIDPDNRPFVLTLGFQQAVELDHPGTFANDVMRG
jgi:hypothetical protein